MYFAICCILSMPELSPNQVCKATEKLRNWKINIISKKGKAHECLETDSLFLHLSLSSITKDLKTMKVKRTNRYGKNESYIFSLACIVFVRTIKSGLHRTRQVIA